MSPLQWGLLTATPLVLNLIAYRKDPERFVDALGISALVAIFWGLTNSIDARVSFPDNKSIHPAIDLLGGAITMFAWWSRRETWKIILTGLFLAQSVLDAAFWLAWLNHPSSVMGYRYVLWLNVLFLAQLVVLGGPGGMVVARHVLSRLSGHTGLGHHVHPRQGV